MTSQLHRLVYVSKAVEGSDVDLWTLTSILYAAQRNNRQNGISGLLLAHDGYFCQVLEGSRTAVDGLMAILAEDPRHTDLTVLCDQPLSEREFESWSMAQAVVTPELHRDLSGLEWPSLGGEHALGVLRRAGQSMLAAL